MITSKVNEDQRRQMIAEAAYFRAERRGFSGGDPATDWIEAEAIIEVIRAKLGTNEYPLLDL